MATYRFYRCSLIAGRLANSLRAKIDLYITGETAETYWSWAYDVAAVQFCLAFAETVTHALAAADADITPLSPELADLAAVNTWLDGTVGTLGAVLITRLESDGFPVNWIDGATTRRELWRFITLHHVLTQRFRANPDADYLTYFKTNLDNTVNSIPAARRNKVRDWMTNNGMDTTWITGTTQVRQVVKYIAVNANLPMMPLGPVTF